MTNKPQTFEEACENATLYVYNNASFHRTRHKISVKVGRAAWLKSFRELLAADMSPEEAITELLDEETEVEVRTRLLDTWIEFVNDHKDLPSQDDSDESHDKSKTLSFADKFRERYVDNDKSATNERKDVA